MDDPTDCRKCGQPTSKEALLAVPGDKPFEVILICGECADKLSVNSDVL